MTNLPSQQVKRSGSIVLDDIKACHNDRDVNLPQSQASLTTSHQMVHPLLQPMPARLFKRATVSMTETDSPIYPETGTVTMTVTITN